MGVDIGERKKAEQALMASKQELRDLSAKLIDAQEKERRRLAMELHDGIGQSLSAINFSLEEDNEKIRTGLRPEKPADLEAGPPR